MAEALGQEEAWQGEPMVGPAGQALNRIIERAKLTRDDFLIANVVNCRPPNNELSGKPYEVGAIEKCSPILIELIEAFRPKAIVALGGVAMGWLTGESGGIDHWRGSVLQSPWGWVVPTYHPSYIQRGNWHLARVVQWDIMRALRVAQEGVNGHTQDYILRPSYMDAVGYLDAWRAAGRPPIGTDIETPYSAGADELDLGSLTSEDAEEVETYTILRISFSWGIGKAITMPWTPPFIEIAQAILAEAGELYTWNGDNFDLPRLRANGAKFTGVHYDLMVAYHLLEPTLPYNLQSASSFHWGGTNYRAWKHQAQSDPEWYSCVDSDALMRNAAYILPKLKEKGMWEMYLVEFVEIARILREMSAFGVPTDRALRAEEVKYWQGELDGVIGAVQAHVPLGVRKKQVYKVSREQLEKKLGGALDPAEWIEVEETLTEKEVARIAAREAREAEKARVKEEKAWARAVRQMERDLAKAAKPKRRPRKVTPTP